MKIIKKVFLQKVIYKYCHFFYLIPATILNLIIPQIIISFDIHEFSLKNL